MTILEICKVKTIFIIVLRLHDICTNNSKAKEGETAGTLAFIRVVASNCLTEVFTIKKN